MFARTGNSMKLEKISGLGNDFFFHCSFCYPCVLLHSPVGMFRYLIVFIIFALAPQISMELSASTNADGFPAVPYSYEISCGFDDIESGFNPPFPVPDYLLQHLVTYCFGRSFPLEIGGLWSLLWYLKLTWPCKHLKGAYVILRTTMSKFQMLGEEMELSQSHLYCPLSWQQK